MRGGARGWREAPGPGLAPPFCPPHATLRLSPNRQCLWLLSWGQDGSGRAGRTEWKLGDQRNAERAWIWETDSLPGALPPSLPLLPPGLSQKSGRLAPRPHLHSKGSVALHFLTPSPSQAAPGGAGVGGGGLWPLLVILEKPLLLD